jgi:hypothetical protein
MNTRPTPETDKHEAARDAMETRGHADYIATLELCREMEIKLAEAQATIETLEIRHAAVMLHTQDIVDEANQFRDQRDRLAVALLNIVSIYENPAKGCIPCSSDMYDEALQSLPPKP